MFLPLFLRSDISDGGRGSHQGLHPAGADWLLPATQVLPVFAVRPDVHGAGGRDTHHPGVPLYVSSGQSDMRTHPQILQLRLAADAGV